MFPRLRKRHLLAASLLATAALAPLAFGAPADPPRAPRAEHQAHREGGHRMGPPRMDLNSDGYITRNEAGTLAETMFARLDTTKDGKLDATDRPSREHRGEGRRGHHERHERQVETTDGNVVERVEIHRSEHGGGHGHHKGRHGGRPHGPPMGMMMMMSHDEADTNRDGALSKEEFVTLHQRFFDAADVNGDGRIKFDAPRRPEAPEPPVPPAPVQPPRR